MKIRAYNNSDLPDLLAMSSLFEYSPFVFDNEFYNPDTGIEPVFASQMLGRSETVTLVLEDPDVAGYISFSINTALSTITNRKIANILLLVVDPAYRGRGLGKYLVARSLEVMLSLGVETVVVGTDIYNIPAINCYEQNGFQTRMSWHIYRKYQELNRTTQLEDSIDAVTSSQVKKYAEYFNRPVSLLKDKIINSAVLREDLFEKFLQKISVNSIGALEYKSGKEGLGVLAYQTDNVSMKALKLNSPAYRITDIMIRKKTDYRKIFELLLRDFSIRVGEYSYLEFWLESTEKERILYLESQGFHLCYTGLNLHKKLS